ncbi:MAG: dicarboxylate/amino acid:cation symporter [Alphaproteobacteria bacterium]|nr:dicarboxylate/amino acid:cation symporter [Alphaproteobacteria bacterium]
MSYYKKLSFTQKILTAMLFGALFGILLNNIDIYNSLINQYLSNGVFEVIGKLFVNSLKMLVVPLVFCSITVGITSLGNLSLMGRIGLKAIIIYLLTTAFAISLALICAIIINPGQGFEIDNALQFSAKEAPSLSSVLISIVPSNPILAMAEGEMLQIILFAIILGIAITITGKNAESFKKGVTSLNEIMMSMVQIIMKFAPLGVFCLIAKTFASQGIDMIIPLASYFFTVTIVLLLHVLLTYSAFLKFIGNVSPILFLKKMRTAVVFAFSTASSNATIPVTLNTVEKRLGVDKSVASFTVPLGATINMDGTAIMQGVATVFIASVYMVDLTIGDYLTVILTATLASIGTAGVPGVGLIMLTMVLTQVGLPVEGVALIIGIDRLLDMMRTAVNITGDSMVSLITSKSEKSFNKSIFEDPKAGL